MTPAAACATCSACRAWERLHDAAWRLRTFNFSFNFPVYLSKETPAMTARTSSHRLQVATELFQFINDKVLPGTGVASAAFWQGFDAIVADLAPKNMALLAERDRLQSELDRWHTAHPGPLADLPAYRRSEERRG